MKHKIALYILFVKLSIKQSIIYRGTWILGVIGQFLYYGASLLSLYILVNTFGNANKWSSYEMMFIFSLSLLAYACAASFLYGPCMMLPTNVKYGMLDQALLKPINILAYEILTNFNIGYVSHIILGSVVLIYSIEKMNIVITSKIVLFIIFSIIGGTLIQGSLLLLSSIFSFYLINGNPIFDLVVYEGKSFIQYPLDIYPKVVQIVLTFIIPYGLINYYPSLVIFDKSNISIMDYRIGYYAPIIGTILYLISVKIWNLNLKYYESSGS